MKRLILVGLIVAVIGILVGIAYATATSETGDARARPYVLYGKTSGGALKPIQVAADGTVQLG